MGPRQEDHWPGSPTSTHGLLEHPVCTGGRKLYKLEFLQFKFCTKIFCTHLFGVFKDLFR